MYACMYVCTYVIIQCMYIRMYVCMYICTYECTFSFSSHSLSLASNLCLAALSSPLSLRTSSFSRRVVLWAWSNSSLNLMLLSDICTALRGVRSEREIEGTYVPLLYPHTPAPFPSSVHTSHPCCTPSGVHAPLLQCNTPLTSAAVPLLWPELP